METDKLALVADITSSYLRRNAVAPEQIAVVIANITTALQSAARDLVDGTVPPASEGGGATPTATSAPAVPIRGSVKRDAIACLECGAKQKTLKRHLQSGHGMTPAQYREKWGLKGDYPMVAPSYSERRSQMAKHLGLGQKAGWRRTRKQG